MARRARTGAGAQRGAGQPRRLRAERVGADARPLGAVLCLRSGRRRRGGQVAGLSQRARARPRRLRGALHGPALGAAARGGRGGRAPARRPGARPGRCAAPGARARRAVAPSASGRCHGMAQAAGRRCAPAGGARGRGRGAGAARAHAPRLDRPPADLDRRGGGRRRVVGLGERLARYHLYRLEREGERVQIWLSSRIYEPLTGRFEPDGAAHPLLTPAGPLSRSGGTATPSPPAPRGPAPARSRPGSGSAEDRAGR